MIIGTYGSFGEALDALFGATGDDLAVQYVCGSWCVVRVPGVLLEQELSAFEVECLAMMGEGDMAERV